MNAIFRGEPGRKIVINAKQASSFQTKIFDKRNEFLRYTIQLETEPGN